MGPALPPPDVIVITGQSLPEAKSQRVYAIERIERRQIEQSPSHQIDQLLKDVPGVQLFRRSDASSGHPTSQGVTLRALGGNASSRTLLTLDGVPQTDPFGGWVNWPAYDADELRQILVVRGGGTVTAGPGALAGTIDMMTRSDFGASGEADYGSRNSIETKARLGQSIGGGDFTVAGRWERGDGFVPITKGTRGPADEGAPYHGWSGRGRWVVPLGQSIELQASADAFHDWRTRGTDFTVNCTDGADASMRLVGRGRWQWSALAYWQWRNLLSSFASVGPGRVSVSRVSLQDSVPSHGLGASFELRPPMPTHVELRFGVDTRRTTGESRELFNYVDAVPLRRRLAGGETWTAGGFAEATSELGRLTLTAGARLDHWQVQDGHLLEKIISSGAVVRDERDASRDGWLPTARGGTIFSLGHGLSVRSAGYLGWRMPTLNELFRPFRAGLDATAANADLDPEKLVGAEAGVEFARNGIRTSVTGFVNRLKGAIANVTLGEGPGVFPGVGFVQAGGRYRQRQNVDSVRVRGVEASAGWSRGPWAVEGGLSWTHARMEGSGVASFLDGLRPAQTPRSAATVSASWAEGGKGARIVLRRVGGQFEDDLNTHLLNGATTLDLFASWPLTRRLQVIGRAENVTNTLVMAAVNGDGSVERATPRAIWIGLRLR